MNKQISWPLTAGDKAYSPLFIDLNNNVNQYLLYGGNRPNDKVTSYTMSALNKILLKSYGLTSLKQEVKNAKPLGVTDADIDLLFKKYEEIL
jgi:hypothetical protein